MNEICKACERYCPPVTFADCRTALCCPVFQLRHKEIGLQEAMRFSRWRNYDSWRENSISKNFTSINTPPDDCPFLLERSIVEEPPTFFRKYIEKTFEYWISEGRAFLDDFR